jgi:uncharacterized protein (DUF2235 family)
MLHKVGLLPASNTAQINFAYGFYKDDSPHGWKMSAEFKKTFCTNVNVHFVGLWDCVASVGFIPRKLPFSTSPTNSIHYFRHAMALDEHRSKFKLCHWQHQDPDLPRRLTLDNTPKAQARRGFSNMFGGSKKMEEDTSMLEKAIENGKTALENGSSRLLRTHDDAVQGTSIIRTIKLVSWGGSHMHFQPSAKRIHQSLQSTLAVTRQPLAVLLWLAYVLPKISSFLSFVTFC